MDKIIFLLNFAAVLYLTGVIWLVQLVQYPLFSFYGKAKNFAAYHASYTFWITPVVAPGMILELVTSILLVFYASEIFERRLVWFGLVLSLTVWASTFFLQVPLHKRLARGFDENAHSALIKTNRIRTAAWTLHSVLLFYFALKIMK